VAIELVEHLWQGDAMEIINISDEYVSTYCKCLEDWSDEMNEAGTLKSEWYQKKKQQGLRVKLAKNEKNDIVGMIHYIPIEQAPVLGNDLYYIYCIWIHGHKQGVGDNRKKGIGKLLLEAAEQDVQELGAGGIAAWGITLPFFMRSKWFKKYGYIRADKEGMTELVWKAFKENAEPPRLMRMKKRPEAEQGKVKVTCFRNGWCPGQNLACERMKRAVQEYGTRIEYVEIDTDSRQNLEEWGIADAIYIDDRQINTGPPPSFKKLQKLLKRSGIH
jgi:N-acetylglutamate synthase-like GNAT family acetyltransferase